MPSKTNKQKNYYQFSFFLDYWFDTVCSQTQSLWHSRQKHYSYTVESVHTRSSLPGECTLQHWLRWPDPCQHTACCWDAHSIFQGRKAVLCTSSRSISLLPPLGSHPSLGQAVWGGVRVGVRVGVVRWCPCWCCEVVSVLVLWGGVRVGVVRWCPCWCCEVVSVLVLSVLVLWGGVRVGVVRWCPCWRCEVVSVLPLWGGVRVTVVRWCPCYRCEVVSVLPLWGGVRVTVVRWCPCRPVPVVSSVTPLFPYISLSCRF